MLTVQGTVKTFCVKIFRVLEFFKLIYSGFKFFFTSAQRPVCGDFIHLSRFYSALVSPFVEFSFDHMSTSFHPHL